MACVCDFGPKMLPPPARVLAVRLQVRTQAVKARLKTQSLVDASPEEARLNSAGVVLSRKTLCDGLYGIGEEQIESSW